MRASGWKKAAQSCGKSAGEAAVIRYAGFGDGRNDNQAAHAIVATATPNRNGFTAGRLVRRVFAAGATGAAATTSR